MDDLTTAQCPIGRPAPLSVKLAQGVYWMVLWGLVIYVVSR